jgi:hypothetical protein
MNKYKNTIYEYENFITVEEQQYLLSIAKDINTQWEVTDNYWNEKNTVDVLPIYEILTSRAKSLFQSYSHFDDFVQIKRFRPGDSMGIHSDEIGYHLIKYGIVLYLNEDFVGGEIEYPDLGLLIKPKARSLVIHPGDVNHQVKKVLHGPTRYMMTTFVHGTGDEPAILKEDK